MTAAHTRPIETLSSLSQRISQFVPLFNRRSFGADLGLFGLFSSPRAFETISGAYDIPISPLRKNQPYRRLNLRLNYVNWLISSFCINGPNFA
jgi:hypothetical protein